jgi:hypothetical protein
MMWATDRVFVPPLGRKAQPFVVAVPALALACMSLYVWSIEGHRDWLLLSGWFALMIGLLLAHSIPDKLDHMLDRLATRGVLVIPPEPERSNGPNLGGAERALAGDRLSPQQLESLKTAFEEKAVTYWSPLAGILIGMALAAAFVLAFTDEELSSRIPLLVVEIFSGFVSGCYLGRMACYGKLGHFLRCSKEPSVRMTLIVGHPDGVGGLSPVGSFFFRQAVIVGIPAAFLAIWLLLIPLPQFRPLYQQWLRSYELLLLLAIAIEVVSFFVPLWSFHQVMVKQKTEYLLKADELSKEIADLQHQLAHAMAAEEEKCLKERLENKRNLYWAIEKLPVWPVNVRTGRLFTLNNFALAFPLISQYTGLSEQWAEFVKGIMHSLGDG